MVRYFKRSDEGMTVRTTTGDEIGTIKSVEGDTAQVEPKPGLSRSVRNRLGWSSGADEAFELQHSNVVEFTGNAILIEG